MIDSTPLVCITAQVAAAALGSDAFQEADIISMTMPVTKWNFQITRAEEIPGAIAKAFYIARVRPSRPRSDRFHEKCAERRYGFQLHALRLSAQLPADATAASR